MIPGDLLSAFPHRQFHTLPGLLDSWAALPNSYPNVCMPMLGGSLYHFYDGLWYDPAERRTHDLPCERRTRYRLSQPDRSASKGAQLVLMGIPMTCWNMTPPHSTKMLSTRNSIILTMSSSVCLFLAKKIHLTKQLIQCVRGYPLSKQNIHM